MSVSPIETPLSAQVFAPAASALMYHSFPVVYSGGGQAQKEAVVHKNRTAVVSGTWLVLAGVAIVVAMASPLGAQVGGSGSIQGVVSDSSGAVIPGATVVATNVATGVETTRQTTEAGFYVVSPLPAGQYTVTVSAAGFQKLVQERVMVDALSPVGFNTTLNVGGATEQVTVSAAPPALNTVDASMNYTMRNAAYQALPLAMGYGGSANNIARDPTQFVTLLPGVTNYGGQSAGMLFGLPLGSAAGHTEEVYVEGIPLTNPVIQGETRYLQEGLSIEAVDQFQLVGASAPVQYTGQGATNFTLKSGTNQLHGAAYEYFRNTDLDARTFFAAARTVEHQNEFGTTIGGPIKKNRIFFFGTYDAFRKRTATIPTLFTIPTVSERTGDFSGFPVAIYDPQTTNCSSAPCTRQPFANNTIPSSRLSPISGYLESFLPTPRNAALTSNFLASNPSNFNINATTEKVDWNLSDKHRFYVMYSHGQKSNISKYSLATLPIPYADSRDVNEIPTTAQLRHTWVPTPQLVNQISLGFARLWVPETNTTIDGQYMSKAGIKGLPHGEADSQFPVITWSGPNTPTGWRGGNSPTFNQAMNSVTLADNVEWTRGKHSVTMGLQAQWMSENIRPETYNNTASWNFSNTQTAGFNSAGTLLATTGNAYASYLLGAVNSNSITDDYVTEVGPRFRTYSWWVGDTYKLTPRLTLNVGLRQDLNTPWVEVSNHLSWLNPTIPNTAIGGFPGILQFAGYGPDSCQCRDNIAMYYRAFGPRGGFAYSLTPKAVLRGGYMMTYTRQGGAGGAGANTGTGRLGYVANPSFSSLDNGISPAYFWDQGVPSYQKAPFYDPTLNTGYNTTIAQGGSVTWGNPQHSGQPPRFQNWNFSAQYAVTSTFTLEGSYVGSNAHYLSGNVMGLPGAALGYWSDQMDPKYLALGNLLNSSATPANVAAAKAMFPEIGLPYPNFAGSISQMLRPFPQYSSVSVPWGNVGNENYNSLQVVGRKTYSHGLIVEFNYVWAKAFSDLLTNRSGYVDEKSQTTDPASSLNVIFAYRLPFGKGQKFTGGGAVVQAIASRWELSGVTTYRSGTGFGAISAACNLPNAGTCYANLNPNFSGPVRINGAYGSGDLLGANPPVFLNVNAFASPAAYTYGNTPPTLIDGLRNPANWNQNVSLRREFRLREGLMLRFQGDAINVINHVIFSGPSTNITSTGFGKITAQANLARVVQFNARITF